MISCKLHLALLVGCLALAKMPGCYGALPARAAASPGRSGTAVVAQCARVHLSAAYLAQVAPSHGPGFLLTVSNDTDAAIKVAKPFPTSAHFYAQVDGSRWLWRASSGSGGALVDALHEQGPLFAYQAPAAAGATAAAKPVEYVTVPAHDHVEWAEAMDDNPALRFRPGCQRCSNPGDERYQAVLAYAYLAPAGEDVEGLLACGLRSGPVVLPPLQ